MKQSWLYGCLSLMMMGLAMLHLKHLTPWVDEVMFLDTPMHYVKGMGWTTFAWYSAARQDPFLLYPPLYSMLMALWMKVFGTTLMACRSLNLVITLSIGWGLLRICRQLGTRPSLPLTVVLVMLLWGTDDMVYMYSNGRPDLLGAAILTFLMSEAIRYAKNGRLGWTLMLISALLLAAAIQAVVCLLLMLLLAYLLLKDHRDTLRRMYLFPFHYFCGLFLWHFPLFSYLCIVLFGVHTFYLLFRGLNCDLRHVNGQNYLHGACTLKCRLPIVDSRSSQT